MSCNNPIDLVDDEDEDEDDEGNDKEEDENDNDCRLVKPGKNDLADEVSSSGRRRRRRQSEGQQSRKRSLSSLYSKKATAPASFSSEFSSEFSSQPSLAPPFRLFATPSTQRLRPEGSHYFQTLRQFLGFDAATGGYSGGYSDSSGARRFEYLIISNYLIDFTFLLEQTLPEILQFHTVLVFYGEAVDGAVGMTRWKELLACTQNSTATPTHNSTATPTATPTGSPSRNTNDRGCDQKSVEFIRLVPSDPPRSKTNPLPSKIPYGVHHTKMFLVGYSHHRCQSKLRVVVHTANLIHGDIHLKTQGAYVQDFPLKRHMLIQTRSNHIQLNTQTNIPNNNKKAWPFEDDDPRPFEDDLVAYLESYRYFTRRSWCSPTIIQPTQPYQKNYSSSKPHHHHQHQLLPLLLPSTQMSLLTLIRQYDFTHAYAILIPSVPGRHTHHQDNYGYLKLRKAIVENVDNAGNSSNNTNQCSNNTNHDSSHNIKPPTLCQFSSIGSLSSKWLLQFLDAVRLTPPTPTTDSLLPPLHDNFPTTKKRKPRIDNSKPNQQKTSSSTSTSISKIPHRIKLIWPTVEEIRTSIEGYRGGISVPGSMTNLAKEFLVPSFCRWSISSSSSSSSGSSNFPNDPLHTSQHVPHIKTYVQPNHDNTIEWMVLTSHNLSKAAWGELQNSSNTTITIYPNNNNNNNKKLFIRHWEMGVFFSCRTLRHISKNNDIKEDHDEDNVDEDDDVGGGDNVRIVPFNGNNKNDEKEQHNTRTVVVPLPYNICPQRYNDDDIPWSLDDYRHSLPDAYGRYSCHR